MMQHTRMPLLLVACLLTTPLAASLRNGLVHGGASSLTPVAKVISLLQRISDQITEEGKSEAAEYDKYACFCKEQVDEKTYNIEKSDEKIAKLKAKIDALDTEIADLGDEVKALTKRITEIEDLVKAETKTRKEERKKYETADSDLDAAIKAVEDAIEEMKGSKKKMKDGAKLDLTQALARVQRAAVVLPEAAASGHALALLGSSGSPPTYEYRSNDIIGVLMNLTDTFKEKKKSLFDDEMARKSESEKKVLGLTTEKDFKSEDKTEKETLIASKEEEAKQAGKDKSEEEKDRKADQGFLDEVTTQCEKRAKEWDQRSTTRTKELTAISEAVELLRTGVNPNYGANKKLAGLQRRAAVVPHRAPLAARVAASFLQHQQAHHDRAGNHTAPPASNKTTASVNSTAVKGAVSAVATALRHLDGAAARLQSPLLSTLAAKVAMHGSQFGKVMAMIKDLIKKLEDQAKSEADSKSQCDTNMAKAVKTRDDEKLKMEEQEAIVLKKKSEQVTLQEDISTLSQEVTELQKALLEATQLRSEEKAVNAKTIEEATAGKAAVEGAIEVLKAFYDAGGALVQVQRDPVDREGKSFKDAAPEVSWKGDYKGNQDASKGIFGLLEVILADFERTIKAEEAAEKEAEKKLKDFTATAEGDIKTKTDDSDKKKKAITTAEDDIVKAQDAQMAAEKLHKSSLEELEDLHAMCVEGAESWGERKASREQEIKSLKGALKILEDWKA